MVAADSLLVDGTDSSGTSAGIFADAGFSGNGGAIRVRAGDAKITAGGQISASTFGIGNGGDVMVMADSLLIDGTSLGFLTGIIAAVEPGSSGDGGSIFIKAGDLRITASGQISSSNLGFGNAGSVNVTADSLFIDGTGSNPLLPPAGISANTGLEGVPSFGNVGSVFVKAGDIRITGGGQISSSTLGDGNAGNVNVTADSLLIDGSESGIFAVAGFEGLASSGIGGGVAVSANSLMLQNEGAISAASFTPSTAGSLQLSLGTLSMDSGSSISSANSSTNNSSANTGGGVAGSVTINTTGPVTVKNGSSISTASTVGDAGDITLISGGEIKLKDQSSITASAGVNGGNITITAPEQLVYLIDSSITATAGSTGSSGTGGNITIDRPEFIVAINSLISATPPLEPPETSSLILTSCLLPTVQSSQPVP